MAQIDLESFFEYYEGLAHQSEAVEMLEAAMPLELLDDSADWIVQYRNAPPAQAKLTPGSPFSQLVTPNIQYGEIALWSEARRFRTQQQCDIATEICEFLEKARAQFGGAIVLTSGYRPEPINSQVGGSSTSEHLYDAKDKGAIDWFLDGVNIYTLQDWCLQNWGFSTGKGAPKGFIHTGMRTGRPRVVWNY